MFDTKKSITELIPPKYIKILKQAPLCIISWYGRRRTGQEVDTFGDIGSSVSLRYKVHVASKKPWINVVCCVIHRGLLCPDATAHSNDHFTVFILVYVSYQLTQVYILKCHLFASSLSPPFRPSREKMKTHTNKNKSNLFL